MDATEIVAKIRDRSLTEADMETVPPENFRDGAFIEALISASIVKFGDDELDYLEPIFQSRLFISGLADHAKTTAISATDSPIIDRLEPPLKTAIRDADPRKMGVLSRTFSSLFSNTDITQYFSANLKHLAEKLPGVRIGTGFSPQP